MSQFHIDEVCPKGSVYPIVVSFQNVYVTEKFKTFDCLLLEDEKTGKKNIITELCDMIYTGEEENEDLGKTLILARNKTTGKVRIIEIENIELKPVNNSKLDTTHTRDTSYSKLSRKFGSKKHKLKMEQCEKLNINVQTVTDQMQNLTEDRQDLSSYNKIYSDEFYIPPINREATKIEEIYDIDTILTPEQFEKIYSEIEGTEYTSNLNPFLKSIVTKTLSPKNTVLLVYGNTLLQLYKTLMKDIGRKNFTACQYSVTLNKIVMNNFLTNINGKRGRTPQYKDKSLCHALVFILLLNSYKFNIGDLCQQFNLAHWTVTSKVAITGATLVSVGNKKFAQLKLETKDYVKTKTNSIQSISKDNIPIINNIISNHKVNRNNDKEIIARKINNENTHIYSNFNKYEFKCKLCNYNGINNNDIKRHSLRHSTLCTEGKPYKCDICQRGFIRKFSLTAHFQIHTGEKPYKCDTCQSSFDRKDNLMTHSRVHTNEKPYKCDICQCRYNYKDSLTAHISKHTGVKPYKCDICQSTFNRKNSLTTHITKHTGEKPYKCDICQSSFNRKISLKTHIRLHTGVKPYKCDICLSRFNQKTSLAAHIAKHTGEKPYKCDICHSSFNRKGYLKTHLLIHAGDKPYKCDICQSGYNQSTDLKKHIRIHTGEKPYKCDICPTSFNHKCSLTAHISKHTGVKPYKCDICQRSFNMSSNLSRHIRVHTGVKPYKCDICRSSFNRKDRLKTHICKRKDKQ